MKHTRRIASLLLALVMVFAMAISVSAESDPATPTNGTITITPPSGVDASATNTYKIYKVFDAVGNGTNISYKLVDGKTTAPTGFTVDTAGNVSYSGTLDDTAIAAIATYVHNDNPVATVTATGSADAVASGLSDGYYYITTSTGTVVTIDSVNPYATVNDKNTVPTVDKKITGASSFDEDGKKALAQVGTDVRYTATITVGKGEKNYVFHDTMGAGLAYNNDAAVTGVEADKYTIKGTPDAGDTITITFTNDIAEGTVITISYSGKITSDALTVDTGKNTAYVSYGDENSNNKTPVSETNTYNAKFTVTKHDGSGNPLADAGFVLKNADGKYYQYPKQVEAAEGGEPKTENAVAWVDSIDDATEYKSDESGAVPAFTGLANGTYTLVEKTVPAGYNKAADQTFTVAEHDYTATNLAQTATVVNNAGSTLPSTGGMGTTLFYVVGGLMVLAAVVLLVTKKRMSSAE